MSAGIAFAGGKPDRYVGRAVDHMVVGDDIAGAVPDKSSSGLHALAFFTSQRPPPLRPTTCTTEGEPVRISR